MARVRKLNGRGNWRPKRYGPPPEWAESFMERGGIYGRSREYPYTGGRICRVFRTAIRVHFRDPDFQRNSLNARAYNAQKMHPLFAYQFRPTPWREVPGGGGEVQTVPMPHLTTPDSESCVMNLRFTFTLPKAA